LDQKQSKLLKSYSYEIFVQQSQSKLRMIASWLWVKPSGFADDKTALANTFFVLQFFLMFYA